MFNRRSLLKASGAGLLAAGLPLSFGASANPLVSGKLKFLFVFAGGGWDTTRVFASEFTNGNVDMEPDAERATSGDLRWVSHWSRPSVDAFMRAYANEIAIVNGMMVRSISHEICTLIAMTGTTASGGRTCRPSWAPPNKPTTSCPTSCSLGRLSPVISASPSPARAARASLRASSPAICSPA